MTLPKTNICDWTKRERERVAWRAGHERWMGDGVPLRRPTDHLADLLEIAIFRSGARLCGRYRCAEDLDVLVFCVCHQDLSRRWRPLPWQRCTVFLFELTAFSSMRRWGRPTACLCCLSSVLDAF